MKFTMLETFTEGFKYWTNCASDKNLIHLSAASTLNTKCPETRHTDPYCTEGEACEVYTPKNSKGKS